LKIAWICAAVLLGQSTDPSPAARDAIAAMQRGDFPSAERTLREELAAHPDDAIVLSLLGATLDNLQRIPEATAFHTRAVAKAPRHIDVLTSYAAHLSMAGNPDEARRVYLRVIAIDPAQYVANLQLARLALKQRNGPDTLHYLDRLPANQRENPPALLLRLEALYLSGATALGDQLSVRLAETAKTDANLILPVISALMSVRQYEKAEILSETALKTFPDNFSALHNLGVVATYAKHYGRAREVLEAALRQQPRNVDVLYALARANEELKQPETAVGLLAQAAKLDPARADVQKLLALTTSELSALDDSAAAWDRYLKLVPDDDTARRERSYTAAQMGHVEQGIAGLEWFLARHPADVRGHYELGMAQRSLDSSKALAHFDKALQLDANYVPARTARGSLYYQEGKSEPAVKDLEIASALRPDDAAALDRLGQAYQALDRTADAVRVLRRAAELAPADSRTLLHFARALADAGSIEESKTVMERFRALGPEKQRTLPAGLVEYLSLTEEQRHADYRARVEKEVGAHPDDAAARVAWLKLLIEDANWDRVREAARTVAALKPGAPVLADAGRALLSGGQYGLARDLLKQAASSAPSPQIQLDLAVAVFRGGDTVQALQEMEAIPESARAGEYYLAHARMFRASGKASEAAAALDRALVSAPARLDFFLQAAVFLAENNQFPDALRFLDQGTRLLPGNREILLLRACALELSARSKEAEGLLTEIQGRWPEWYPGWVAHGIVLRNHNQSEGARRALETAAALAAPADRLGVDLKGILSGALFR
jgi:tetratricopeptide (TPR) repeat protein